MFGIIVYKKAVLKKCSDSILSQIQWNTNILNYLLQALLLGNKYVNLIYLKLIEPF